MADKVYTYIVTTVTVFLLLVIKHSARERARACVCLYMTCVCFLELSKARFLAQFVAGTNQNPGLHNKNKNKYVKLYIFICCFFR